MSAGEAVVEAPAAAEKTETGSLAGTLQSLMATMVIVVFVTTFVVQAFQIPSESMENTLLIGDYLLVDKVTYGGGSRLDSAIPYREVRRGDIIVFRYPVDPTKHFVKRVVGVPGDRIRLFNKKVFINGVALEEPYVRFSSRVHDLFRDDFPRLNIPTAGLEGSWWLQMRKLVEDGELIVPEGNYFAMGDNRDESLDSRYWGFVPRENIIGRPLVIYWSLNSPQSDTPMASTTGDKIFRFVYAVTHLFKITRWDRTFRLVH